MRVEYGAHEPRGDGREWHLGVGVARYDCGIACAGSTPRAGYYYADIGPATPISMPLANQVANPVALFPVDNNGLIVDMPPIAADGAPTATGTVTFGIGTQANNLLAGAGATVLATDRWCNFSGSVGNGSMVQTFMDSGSNTLSFEDWSIVQDSGFYVPASPLKRTVTLSGANGVNATTNIVIGNADALFASMNFAFSNLASFLAQTVDLDMPFFYGRSIYSGIAGRRRAQARPGRMSPTCGASFSPLNAMKSAPARFFFNVITAQYPKRNKENRMERKNLSLNFHHLSVLKGH